METILFSIIVPVYNTQDYLPQTVASILPQLQGADFRAELLLIDDGSTDGSAALCDEYADKYPDLIRAFHKENEGLLLTRRFGFQQAQGLYMVNCDSDDILESDALKKLAQAASRTDTDVILFNLNSWSPPDKVSFSQDLFATETPDKKTVLRSFFYNAGVVSMCAKCFKRSCLNLNKDYSRYYKKSFGEDTLQSAEIYTNAQTFAYINAPLYNYRAESGMTGQAKLDYFQEFTKINAELEGYKALWSLENFDDLVAYKVFVNAARAITQMRSDATVCAKQRRSIMESIRKDPMFIKYESNYCAVQPHLKGSYRIILNNLLKNRYSFIELALRLKNILGK